MRLKSYMLMITVIRYLLYLYTSVVYLTTCYLTTKEPIYIKFVKNNEVDKNNHYGATVQSNTLSLNNSGTPIIIRFFTHHHDLGIVYSLLAD